jgi:pyruvate/2-oxoglutarate dehydrogenase complex dihydrolipoamide dehydrogenase (E3) component
VDLPRETLMPDPTFDLIVLGAGSAGLSAANVARGLGASVAIVERGRLGGECTWRGCVPSKTLLAAARAAHTTRDVARFGLTLERPAEIGAEGIMAHVRSVSAKVSEHESAEVLESRGIEVFSGEARFVAPHAIEVDGRTLIGDHFVIATGSRPILPPVPGLDETTALTSDTLWDTDGLPVSLVIVGGGPVAVEMASALTRLGTKVTLLVRSRLLKAEEPELVDRLSAVLVAQGVEIVTGAGLERVEAGDGVSVTAGGRSFVAERLLVATGRKPVFPEGLQDAGVEVDERGIVVDAHMRSSVRHIFAAGDIAGPYHFTHTAEREGIAAASNAVLPIGRRVSWDDIVWVLFTEPELAHLGMTEEQARAAHGDDVSVRRYEFAIMDRARAESATTGLAKYVLDRRGHLLGAHILGERAGEIIHEAAILLHEDLPFSSLSPVLHAYPTFTDCIKRPADAAYADRLRGNAFAQAALHLLRRDGDEGAS